MTDRVFRISVLVLLALIAVGLWIGPRLRQEPPSERYKFVGRLLYDPQTGETFRYVDGSDGVWQGRWQPDAGPVRPEAIQEARDRILGSRSVPPK